MKALRLNNEQLSSLCDSLAYLMGAGLSAGDALTLLQQDAQQSPLGEVLEQMARKTDGGMPLDQALQEAGCFPSFVCSLLHIGHQVGKTEQTLTSLAQYYRRQEARKRRLSAALTYPAVLLAVLLAVITVLLVWVMPIFDEVYASLGGGLTGLAGWLLRLGDGLRLALPWIGSALATAVCLMLIPPVRRGITGWIAARWGDEGVLGQLNSARLLQALSLGLECGMTEKEAVTLASQLAAGEAPGFLRRCDRCAQAMDGGSTLGAALRENGFLTHSEARLLLAAAQSGHGQQALATVAQDAQLRSEDALEKKLSTLEPAMVAVACALIAGVLICVMVPLLHIMNSLG